ncbi:MAG: HAMP domain-containing histidine kinase [Labilithrix sp.]|nr:HAMP domain-containing histidine kinase [Labilithrix sp.]
MPNRAVSRARGGRASRARAGRATSETPKQDRDPLLSAICHDLRAPLAAVTMGANFVLQTTRRESPEARTVQVLEAMIRSCAQMERLIKNFADLSEIEANAVTLRLGLHDAGEILELAANAARDAARTRSVTIEVRRPPSPLTVKSDRERILRAVGHVLENAVKHAPEGSAVTLAVEPRGRAVELSITDRGPGLDPELQQHLFDRQWLAARSSRAGGFGLAIARGFVEAHGGRIDVESNAAATTFTLVVPTEPP